VDLKTVHRFQRVAAHRAQTHHQAGRATGGRHGRADG
jgi:hypothetical protein